MKKVDGKTVVPVYLLDNSVKQLLVEDWATAKDVVLQMCVKIGLKDVDRFANCFCLCETRDGVTMEHPLKGDTAVIPVLAAWGDAPRARLVFMVKLFMDSVKASTEKALVYSLYIQSVYNVVTGIYPTSTDDAVSLASLQMQEKFGNHNPAAHVKGYLSHQLKGMVPAPLYARKAPSMWESSILERHSQLNDEARAAPALLYSRILQTREYFGCAFFPVTQTVFPELPSAVQVGITSYGIYIFDDVSKATHKRFALSTIYRWGFKPDESFYFELKSAHPGQGPFYEFPTVEGSFASDLLTDYAHQMLHEIELNKQQESAAASAAAAAEEEAAAAAAAEADRLVTANRERAAAVRLQSLYKGYQVRSSLHKKFAAVRIQALVRGFIARCRFDAMIAELEAELEAED
ncbi:Tln1 [Symbiodinium sp. KB8]|nr:Tln1 [Symbiodinium sp. KB8]